MKTPKRKRTIAQSKFTPPVGFQIAPSAPAGGGSNVPAMRPTFAFLPYNADEINKRIFAGKLDWKSKNPALSTDLFPGIPDLYGTPSLIGTGSQYKPPAPPTPAVQQQCPDGQRWRSDNGDCECAGATYWCNKQGRCVDWITSKLPGC